MILTVTGTGYRVAGHRTRRDETIVALHGNPFGDDQSTALGDSLRAGPGRYGGLYTTGHTVHHPWTGANWGTGTDAHDSGGHGLGVIDTIAPAGQVHLVGTSMGGYNAALWASRHADRVASLTLISPGIDLATQYDHFAGNQLLDEFAAEIATCWAGDPDATRADVIDALAAADATAPAITAGLAPIADRIWLVCATDDPLIVVDTLTDLADNLGLDDTAAVFFDTGNGTDRHPAPYRPDLGWDSLTVLRHITHHSKEVHP